MCLPDLPVRQWPIVLVLGAVMLAACAGGGSDALDTVPSESGDASTEDAGLSSSVDPIGGPQAQTVAIGGGEIALLVQTPPDETEGPTVLFLHGAAFNAQTWVDNGILEMTAEADHLAIAVDLPGSGSSDSVEVEHADFLVELFAALELDPTETVIVSPSFSGIYSLPALRDPFFTDLGGFVPVAPSGAGAFPDNGEPVDVPALLVWGDSDGADPLAAANRLAEGFTHAEVLILADADHAAYQQQPVAFAEALIDFAVTVSP